MTYGEPWMVNGKANAGWRIDDSDPNRLGMAFLLTPTALVADRERAERIVACVNALAGLDPEAVKRVVEAARGGVAAIEGMQAALEECLTEWISQKRAANWGVINSAGVEAAKVKERLNAALAALDALGEETHGRG